MPKRNILITGVTGFIGGALAAKWASGIDALIAIVRAPTVEHARARVAASVARFIGPERSARFAGAIDVVAGDLSAPETFDRSVFDAVTHVVHSAACTSFTSMRRARQANIEGTTLLAERMRRAPQLERFLHVSSAYCCGDRPNRLVHEDDSPRAEHGYVNEYSRTKAEAERRLLSMAQDIPLVIARPSVVIGHTTLGVRPSSSLFWYYRALAALGAGPFGLADRRDVVPVDYVADALDFLLHLERPKFATYHISAGGDGAVTVEEIVTLFGPPPTWRTVSPGELGEIDISRLVRTAEETRQLARALEACARFGALRIEFFHNERILSEGFRAAPRFTDYLPCCIRSSGRKTIYEQMFDDV